MAAAVARCIDVEAEDAPAAPDTSEPEHILAPRDRRRFHDVAEVESHHGAAGQRRAGGNSHPRAGERVVVQNETASNGAVEELAEDARERSFHGAQVRPEPSHIGR